MIRRALRGKVNLTMRKPQIYIAFLWKTVLRLTYESRRITHDKCRIDDFVTPN